MRDKSDAWQMEITTINWEFENLLMDLGLNEINHKPHPTSWSIAQNLSHLIRVNESYYPIFDQLIKGQYKTPMMGKIPIMVNAMGNLLFRAMRSKLKTKTFEIWTPASKEYEIDIVAEFSNHQMELSAYLQKLDPYFESNLVIHSPVNQLLVYSLDKSIDIIIAHEKRHLQQCKNLVGSLNPLKQ